MKTKTRPNELVKVSSYYDFSSDNSSATGREKTTWKTYATGSDTITYGEGKKLPSGVWPWKPCSHSSDELVISDSVGQIDTAYHRSSNPARRVEKTCFGIYVAHDYLSLGAEIPPNEAMKGIISQIDLNSGESVLLYANVIQAVPLLGSVLRLSSILNKAARNLSKSFRKKPFTTVVKSLISADFIDRFVISPMLDDARKFQDACDYVLRVIQTARERSSHRFALSSVVKTIYDEANSSVNVGDGTHGYFICEKRRQSFAETKAFALLEAKYDVNAVSPIKLWANRVGLTKPMDSVWDLIPFSFVLDYFIREGDFIGHLSNELSSIEGLKGKITTVHDLWYTTKVESSIVTKPTGYVLPAVGTSHTLEYQTALPGRAESKICRFNRSRISNAYSYLRQLSRRPETYLDYFAVDFGISATRKRTLAELVIQAKL